MPAEGGQAMKAPAILYDNDVERLLDMSKAVETIQLCLRAKSDGRLIAPPRSSVAFEHQGALVFTVGGLFNVEGEQNRAGFRVYTTFPELAGTSASQLVAVWNPSNGSLLGVIIGEKLGALRRGQSVAWQSTVWQKSTQRCAALSERVGKRKCNFLLH